MLYVPNVPTLNKTFWLLTFFRSVKAINDIVLTHWKKNTKPKQNKQKKTKTSKNQQEKIMTPPPPPNKINKRTPKENKNKQTIGNRISLSCFVCPFLCWILVFETGSDSLFSKSKSRCKSCRQRTYFSSFYDIGTITM